MKLYKSRPNPRGPRETLRERWERALLSRRVDAKGLEPIRLRVRLLREQRERHQRPPL